MAFASGTISGGRKRRRRGLQGRVVGDGKTLIVRHALRLAVFQVSRHNSEQVRDLLLAARVRDEPTVIDPVGETHAHLLSRRASSPSLSLKENDSWRRASRGTLVDRIPLG